MNIKELLKNPAIQELLEINDIEPETVKNISYSNSKNIKVNIDDAIIIIQKNEIPARLRRILDTILKKDSKMNKQKITTVPVSKKLDKTIIKSWVTSEFYDEILPELKRLIPLQYADDLTFTISAKKKKFALKAKYFGHTAKLPETISIADISKGTNKAEVISLFTAKATIVVNNFINKNGKWLASIPLEKAKLSALGVIKNYKIECCKKLLKKHYQNTETISIINNKLQITEDERTLVSTVNINKYDNEFKPKIVQIDNGYKIEYILADKDILYETVEAAMVKVIDEVIKSPFIVKKYKNENIVHSNIDKVRNKYKKLTPLYAGEKVNFEIEKHPILTYLKDTTMTCKFEYGEIQITDKITCILKYSELINDFDKFINLDLIKFVESEFKKLGFNTQYKSGNGLMYGDTTINCYDSVMGYNFDFIFNFKLPSFEEADIWKQCFEENIEKLKKQYNVAYSNKVDKILDNPDSVYNKFIAKDIVDFVSKNNYITANAVAQYMTGKKVQLDAIITGTKAQGKYSLYSQDEVKDIIDILVRQKFLYEKVRKGHYGKFKTLHVYDKSLIKINLKVNRSPEDIIEKMNEGKYINDNYASIYFHSLNKENLTMVDYVRLLNLLSAKGFISSHYDEYIELLRTAPEEFKTLLKMKKKISEDNYEKKIYRDILKKQ